MTENLPDPADVLAAMAELERAAIEQGRDDSEDEDAPEEAAADDDSS